MDRDKSGVKRNVPDKVFMRYLLTLQTSALVALGKVKNPITNKTTRDLAQAREVISILSMMKTKTDGNLNAVEHKVLTSIVSNIQMTYVNEIIAEDKKDSDIEKKMDDSILKDDDNFFMGDKNV